MNWFARYHSYLVSRAESESPATRWMELRSAVFPWFIPLLVLAGLSYLARLGERANLILGLLAGAVTIIGVIYVSAVMLIYGTRIDIRRAKAAKAREQ